MATIVLQVPDENLVSKVKQACKMLKGVASVKVQSPTDMRKIEVVFLRQHGTEIQEIRRGH